MRRTEARATRDARWPGVELVEQVRARAGGSSDLGLVLGSGLGPIAGQLRERTTIAAQEMEGYPSSTVAGHEGKLHRGTWHGRSLWCVQGRVHLYEGHTPEVATRHVRLLHALGVRTLLLTNAAGSVDARVGPGEIVLDRDALSLFFRPLAVPARGGADAAREALVSRGLWRRRSALTDPDLAREIREVARELGLPLQEGTLVGGLGPSYETAAEVRAWRRLGGTVTSMSTVPEAVQARELGMRVAMLSLVTNLGTGLSPTPLSHEEVVAVADRAGARLAELLGGVVARL